MLTLEEITCGESRNIEFKVMLPEKSQNYLKTVVAFANTVGGKLIIGVEDKAHRVVGVDDDALFHQVMVTSTPVMTALKTDAGGLKTDAGGLKTSAPVTEMSAPVAATSAPVEGERRKA